MRMPMSVDEKAIVKTYLSRKLRTLPILIIMIFSFLVLCTHAFDWARGQLVWRKIDVEITMVNEDGGGFYRCIDEKTGEIISGTYAPYRILLHYQISKPLKVHDVVRIAYNPRKPNEKVVFARLELQMLTWSIVFVFCFIIYFWLEWVIKKRAKIKIAG